MLEDFIPQDDKSSGLKGGDVIQPNNNPAQPTAQPPVETAKTTGPAGPYKATILAQPSPTDKPTNSQQAPTSPADKPISNEPPKGDQATSSKENETEKMSKKPKSVTKKILITLSALMVVGGGGFAGWWFGLRDSGVSSVTKNNSTPNSANSTAAKTTEPKLVQAALSGLDVTADIAARPVTGIMIENSEGARPQSGLQDADVIFEAIAEGGITRFLALYQSKKPDYIGPVRSARPYYVEWAKTFDAGYAHAGGSPDGLQTISSLGVKDINAFAYGSDIFYRTSDREAPHNLYTSFKGLDKVNQDKGYTTSKFTGWNRKKDVPQTPTAKTIDITISSPYYNPSYTYDVTTNSYLRKEGGEIHKDDKTGKQLAPKVVLVMVMDRSQNGIYSVYKTNGSGKFYAFQDGIVTEGTWSRAGNTDQYAFKDANGFDYLFNKGQAWVSIVTDANNVKYAP